MYERIPKEGSSYSRWFDYVMEKAELYDYGRYPVKGCGIWLPYGFKIRRFVLNYMRKLLDETGHEEILMPLLIPEDLLSKEKEHIEGFKGEVYWVTKGGEEDLDVKLALRPTSETVISLYESYWLKSYKQLPRKYYQIVNIFRYETKATKPMIRVREVTTFKEAHTIHETYEDAEKQVVEAINIYRKFFDALGIPYLISKRPDWDKFAGALYTIAFDTIMPDGRTLQIGTVHNLGQNFTKVFEVRIQLSDESIDYAWQTSYGISERVIAALISVHGDDLGLILPPEFAPIQVVIVPIPIKNMWDKILEISRNVYESLKAHNIRVHLDDREEYSPGYKFYDWELRGVPLRIEIGSKEVNTGTVTLADRLERKRKQVPLDEVVKHVKEELCEIGKRIRKKAKQWFETKIFRIRDLDEARKVLSETKGVLEIPWCGKEECGHAFEDILDVKILGSPLSSIEKINIDNAKCPICGGKALTLIRLAKQY